MSRNRLSDLPPSSNPYYENQQDSHNNVDLERNDLVAGEQYELQDRANRQLTLNEYREDVLLPFISFMLTRVRSKMQKKLQIA